MHRHLRLEGSRIPSFRSARCGCGRTRGLRPAPRICGSLGRSAAASGACPGFRKTHYSRSTVPTTDLADAGGGCAAGDLRVSFRIGLRDLRFCCRGHTARFVTLGEKVVPTTDFSPRVVDVARGEYEGGWMRPFAGVRTLLRRRNEARSEADPPLLRRTCRSSAPSAARTRRPSTWRYTLAARSGEGGAIRSWLCFRLVSGTVRCR